MSGDVTLLNHTRYCKTWIEILDKYLEIWEKRLGGLNPSDQSVPCLQNWLELAILAKIRLVEIRNEVVRDAPPARYLRGRVATRTLYSKCPVFGTYFVHVVPYRERLKVPQPVRPM